MWRHSDQAYLVCYVHALARPDRRRHQGRDVSRQQQSAALAPRLCSLLLGLCLAAWLLLPLRTGSASWARSGRRLASAGAALAVLLGAGKNIGATRGVRLERAIVNCDKARADVAAGTAIMLGGRCCYTVDRIDRSDIKPREHSHALDPSFGGVLLLPPSSSSSCRISRTGTMSFAAQCPGPSRCLLPVTVSACHRWQPLSLLRRALQDQSSRTGCSEWYCDNNCRRTALSGLRGADCTAAVGLGATPGRKATWPEIGTPPGAPNSENRKASTRGGGARDRL